MKRKLYVVLGTLCLCLGLTACTPGAAPDSSENPTGIPSATPSDTQPTTLPTDVPATETPAGPKADSSKLKGCVGMVKRYKLDEYVNKDIMEAPLTHAEELIASGTATQEEYDMALQAIRDTLSLLHDGEDRYLFIISSYIYEDWTNPPAMWETYKEAKKIFEYLGEGDHIAFQIHKEGHAVIDEDVVALLDFADYHLYGKTDVETDFSKFDTCIFAEQEPVTQ